GIVVGAAILILLVLGSLLFCIRRRRQRLNKANSTSTDQERDLRAARTNTLSPFTTFRNQTPDDTPYTPDPPSVGRNGSTLARQILQTELQAATEKITELGDQDRRPRSSPPDPNVDLEAQLQAAREENGILVARINEMETNTELGLVWGRGGGEEPPPEYTGRGINP
ncbi:hypothetical protein R3P38DRAFT_3524222, partial [Favolaschia claudopus]